MPTLNFRVCGLYTNFDWQGDIFKFVNYGDSLTLVVSGTIPSTTLGANPVILDLLQDSLKDDVVYSVDSVTEKPLLRAVLMWSFVARACSFMR